MTPAAVLFALFASGLTSRGAVESALMLEPGKLSGFLAGEDVLTEAEEARVIALVGDYERRIRQANAEMAADCIVELLPEDVAGTPH